MRPRRVVGPIHRLRGVLISNVYVIDGGPGDRFVIDTGHFTERRMLTRGLRRLGFAPHELTGVLLTHRHSDHAGNAAYLHREFGIPIYAHRADAEVLEGRAAQAPIDVVSGNPFIRAIAKIEDLTGSRVPIKRALSEGDTLGSLEVHHLPGHTAGSVFYRHAGTRTLLTGDMLLAVPTVPLIPALPFVPPVGLPHIDYSDDRAAALDTLRAFHREAEGYENLLAGHGAPVLGGARAWAERALEKASRTENRRPV